MTFEQYEHSYRRRTNSRVLAILAAQTPIFFATAAYNQLPLWPIIGWTLFTLLLPVLYCRWQPESRAAARVVAVAAMFLSAIFIHSARGASEAHFHVFVTISILIVLADMIALLLAAATIAAHHIAFFFLWPASIFDYAPAFPSCSPTPPSSSRKSSLPVFSLARFSPPHSPTASPREK
jgi:hypothetical protein